MAIPTNEELVIAQIAYRLIARKKELCNDERI
jgi:acetate kinase